MTPGMAPGSADNGVEKMLVLSRKVGERVVIDGGIVVTLVRIDGNQVRLAFEAPREVGIYREEVLPGRAGPSIPRDRPDPPTDAGGTGDRPSWIRNDVGDGVLAQSCAGRVGCYGT